MKAITEQRRFVAELDALLPAILPSSLDYDSAGDRACIHLYSVTARHKGEM
jgi:hypothetical protein